MTAVPSTHPEPARHRSPRRWAAARGLVLVAALALAVAACGSSSKSSNAGSSSSSSSSSSSGNAAAGTAGTAVTIKDFSFKPGNLKAKVGDKVTFTNSDGVNHTVTSDSSSTQKYDSGDLSNGKSYSVTYAKAGTYSYHCDIHQYMKGTVTVG